MKTENENKKLLRLSDDCYGSYLVSYDSLAIEFNNQEVTFLELY